MNIIGIMSGSSMDGLDAALCSFQKKNNKISAQILNAHTFTYPPHILNILNNIRNTSASVFFEHNVIYGQWIGKKINQWIKKHHLHADAIAVHGHTVFHFPPKGFSVQLGSAHHIAAACNLPVIHNFRNLDIAHGGQGAPLVPMGDKLLFGQYDACLNIGGIANIFIQKKEMAYDICIANMALNYFANQIGKKYDNKGKLAQSGTVNTKLLYQINQLDYFQKTPPKSLNREYFEKYYLSTIKKFSKENPQNILTTLTHHIAYQISKAIAQAPVKKVLITGGGAFNHYLISLIKQIHPNKEIIIPEDEIVKYKEALIFALLGYLRLNKLPNVLIHTTGAAQKIICGDVIL